MKLLKIGSSSSCDIVINSQYVSAHHADLTLLDNGDIILEDKDSTNGTFVGTKKVSPNEEVTIRRGDLVRFADESLVWARVPVLESASKYKTIVNIGSNYRNDIVLNNAVVSRFHACVKIKKDGKAFLVDNGSKNGTQLNGVKIMPDKPMRIKKGDNVICGGEDITEQLKPYLPSVIPGWMSATLGVVALVVVGLMGVYMVPIIKEWINGPDRVDPTIYRPSIVYVRAAFHYEVDLKDNPLSDENKGLLQKATRAIPYQATAFFIDREGRMATNRHVACPWEEEYRGRKMTEGLIQEYQKFIVDQLRVESLDMLNVLDSKASSIMIRRLYSTPLGRVLVSESTDIEDLQAKINRIKKSEIVITGEMDYITVGYPGQYYTHEDEFQRCYVLAESGNKDIDIAILQLNDKHTPDRIEHILSIENCYTEKIQPQKDVLYSWGFPNGLAWGLTEKTKSLEPTLTNSRCSKVQDRYEFEFQANSVGGSSGSPVFNEYGQLYGILSSGYTNSTVTFAVLSRYLKKLYDEEVLY